MTQPESEVLRAIAELERDDIDDIVDVQLDARMERVRSFVEAAGITLTPWQVDYIRTVLAGGTVVGGRRVIENAVAASSTPVWDVPDDPFAPSEWLQWLQSNEPDTPQPPANRRERRGNRQSRQPMWTDSFRRRGRNSR